MKEPWVRDLNVPGDAMRPYSQTPTYMLQDLAVRGGTPCAELAADPFYSPDFRRAYAARLLRERGL